MKSISTICIYFIIIYLFSNQLLTAAVYNVDNIADTDNAAAYINGDGNNTLRKCIRVANLSLIKDTIRFNLVGVAPFTILLSSNLPQITSPILIDGFSQTGVTFPTPGIVLKGAGLASTVSPINNIFFLNSGSSNSIIRGLIMYRTLNIGVYVTNVNNCLFEGCWIGITENGIVPTPNTNKIGEHGLFLVNGANDCIIGSASARNIISGNMGHGIVTVNNVKLTIVNNYIGTNVNATDSIPNGLHGINIESTTQVTIGGSTTNLGNVISGNKGQGITIFNNSAQFDIKGNQIGTNRIGTLAIANGVHGINVESSINGIIGGSGLLDGNLISGNKATGITLTGGANDCQIKGNKIGTNLAGTAAIANGSHGISIYTNVFRTIIGGQDNTEGNIISGNGYYGINNVLNSRLTKVYGNLIGTNANGTAAIPNQNHGIYFESSNNVTVGSKRRFRNIISGNMTNGLAFLNCDTVSILGNFIGTTKLGNASLPNSTGISITNCTNFIIGADTSNLYNLISGNQTFGFFANNLDNTRIAGNRVGVDSLGNTAIANGLHGIHTEGGCDLISLVNNVVSGNTQNGMDLLLLTNSTIYGNKIGLGSNGLTKVANGIQGIRINGGLNNSIGSANKIHRNYISGNGNHAILFDNACNNNQVKGNYVGTDTSGLVSIGNNNSGIILLDNSTNNQIGGINNGEGNIFCCSLVEDGIRVQVSPSTLIYNNLIGVNKNGVLASGFGNAVNGIWIMAYGPNSNNCEIGGIALGKANVIANNGGDGVKISGYGNPSNFIPIIGNKINCNGGAGINFEANNVFENEGIAAPIVTASTANSISGTGAAGNTVHIYRNNYTDGTRCDCEGEIYVGTTIIPAGGNWTFTHNLALTPSQQLAVTATQTNSNKSTSEFWFCASPLSATFLTLKAVNMGNKNKIIWETKDERNNGHFIVERSNNGNDFYQIASLKASNQSNIISNYEYLDEAPFDGTYYYRIVSIDFNNVKSYSKIVSISNFESSISIYPNPTEGIINIYSLTELPIKITICDAVGKSVLEIATILPTESIDLSSFAKGVYVINLVQGENQLHSKIILK